MSLKLPELKLLHKGLILVLVPLAIQLIFVATLGHLLLQTDYQARRLSHAKEVQLHLNTLMQDLLDTGRAAAMYKVTRKTSYRDESTTKAQQMFADLALLNTLSGNSKEERAAFEKINPIAKDALLIFESTIRKAERREEMHGVEITNITEQIADSVGRLKLVTGELETIERQVENDAPLAEARSRELVMSWIAGGIVLDVVAAVGLALFFNKQLLNRLTVMIENTRRLASNSALLPRTAGGDEIAHLDKVFHEMAQALQDASEHKKELVSMVGHDLRTPLTSIQASLALLEVGACGVISDRAKDEVVVAERSATRLINLINDLLDIEMMEAGKLEMSLRPTHSLSILESSVESVAAFAALHHIEVDMPGEDYSLIVDHDRLVQVLVNLLSNAIKFSPDFSTVTLDVVEKPGCFEFRVKDQGPGIAPDYKESIFDRFRQVDGITSTKLKGSGLGLAICKAIVQGHNGEIGLDSEIGKGTTFWFRVPKATDGVAASECVPS